MGEQCLDSFVSELNDAEEERKKKKSGTSTQKLSTGEKLSHEEGGRRNKMGETSRGAKAGGTRGSGFDRAQKWMGRHKSKSISKGQIKCVSALKQG